jgi:abortive infection bacteriophage resistance protein
MQLFWKWDTVLIIMVIHAYIRHNWPVMNVTRKFFKMSSVSWSSESSGMYCHVLNWMSTDVSEVHAASIIRVMRHLWNVVRHSIKNTEAHTRRFWDPLIIIYPFVIHTNERTLSSRVFLEWLIVSQLRKKLFMRSKGSLPCEISHSQGSKHEDGSLLGYSTL